MRKCFCPHNSCLQSITVKKSRQEPEESRQIPSRAKVISVGMFAAQLSLFTLRPLGVLLMKIVQPTSKGGGLPTWVRHPY